MAITAFPGGASSFGVPVLPAQRHFNTVLWVGNASGLPAGDGSSPDFPLSTLFGASGALAKAHATLGTLINVLPGHAENVSAADMASDTGTKVDITIRGLGGKGNPPVLTWTVATSTWLFDTAGIVLENLKLLFAGADAAGSALTVAAPITVSAARCGIRNCIIRFGFDADQIVTTGITFTAAADDFMFEDNHCSGATAAECTTFMQIIGCDRLIMRRNYIAGATSSTTVGIVRFATTASLDIVLEDNTYVNRKAASAAAVTGLAGVSGTSREELFCYLDDTSTTMWLTSPGIMHFYNPRTSNLAGEAGMLSTVVST